jgi:hypothetical protein
LRLPDDFAEIFCATATVRLRRDLTAEMAASIPLFSGFSRHAKMRPARLRGKQGQSWSDTFNSAYMRQQRAWHVIASEAAVKRKLGRLRNRPTRPPSAAEKAL